MSRISKKPLTVSGVMREHEDVDIRRLIHLVLDSPSLPLSEERVVSKDGKLISGPLESPDGTTSLKEFKGKNTLASTRLIINMAAQAINGDVKAADFLMKYGGFTPPREEKVSVDLPVIIDDMTDKKSPAEEAELSESEDSDEDDFRDLVKRGVRLSMTRKLVGLGDEEEGS